MRELWVWMNGELVGRWSRGRTGHHRFTYEKSWLASPRVRAISLSMPISMNRTVEGDSVVNFFDNLLPDSEQIRKRLSIRYKTKSVEAFELLQAIGRDCVGAIQLLPAGQEPVGFNQLSYEVLHENEIEQLLQDVVHAPGVGRQDVGNDLRISIAGAQEKTALLRIGKQWCFPKGATPTTHILKLPMGLVGGRKLDLSHSVENEWLCGQLLNELGLSTATSEIASFGGQKALVVQRFDRQFAEDNHWIIRLPQEDFCQALGHPSNQKYEVDGGPGIAECLSVLASSQTPDTDRQTFLCAQLAFWLLAATDGHAKNFSVFLLPGYGYRLTPLYDVLSAWPVIGEGKNHIPWHKARLAMAIRSQNAHYRLSEIQTRHWKQLAQKSGVPDAWLAMRATVDKVDTAIEAVAGRLSATFPAEIADPIFSGVQKLAKLFRNGLTA